MCFLLVSEGYILLHVSCRPLMVSTEEYGTMWLAFSNDTKQNLTLISDEQEPLAATLNVLRKKLQLHIVEIIGEHIHVALFPSQRGLLYRGHDFMLNVFNIHSASLLCILCFT